jgi:DNA modification methylase
MQQGNRPDRRGGDRGKSSHAGRGLRGPGRAGGARPGRGDARADAGSAGPGKRDGRGGKAPLRLFPTTLWEYESQHYESASGVTEQGDRDYVGATPSWIIWQLLQRYTKEKDLVVDPMCGSGTTIDVARDLKRRGLGYDLSPPPGRSDIFRADARKIPLEDEKADFVFIDPPYSTHVDYSDDPRCIGKLDAGGADQGKAYYDAMDQVFAQIHRILRPSRVMGLYVSDSFRKKPGAARNEDRDPAVGEFMPIGFELFARLQKRFTPVDIVSVVRRNRKLEQGNWRAAAERENFFLRGFNYLFILKKG